MTEKPKQISQTAMGTPVYAVEVPKDKLVGCGRVHNPPARGELSQHLCGLVTPPACFIIECDDKKFKRIFRVDVDGMLFPVTLDIISSKERDRLGAEGIIGWDRHAKRRGSR